MNKSCVNCRWKHRSVIEKLLSKLNLSRFFYRDRRGFCANPSIQNMALPNANYCSLQTMSDTISIYTGSEVFFSNMCGEQRKNWEPVKEKDRFIYRLSNP